VRAAGLAVADQPPRQIRLNLALAGF